MCFVVFVIKKSNRLPVAICFFLSFCKFGDNKLSEDMIALQDDRRKIYEDRKIRYIGDREREREKENGLEKDRTVCKNKQTVRCLTMSKQKPADFTVRRRFLSLSFH